MHEAILKKLEQLKKQKEELNVSLSDPKVISNNNEYKRCAKELARISPIVKKYEDYLQLKDQAEQAEALLEEEKDVELSQMAKSELEQLEEQMSALLKELENILIEDDPEGSRDAIMEIRAGTGGLEASLFAADLYRMYSKYASRRGWKTEVMSSNQSEAGGFKEVIFSVEGENVYKMLKYESGIHRVQRVPTTEASGRIHTSAVSVAVLPEAEEVDIQIDPKDLKIDVFRATGPGGQGVNTTDSAVRITYFPTNTVVSCQDERSQLKNKSKAMKVLRARLLDEAKHAQKTQRAQDRKAQVGTGDRSEKIRTYNFPQRRITDHRISFTVHKLEAVLEGDLDDIIKALLEADRKLRANEISRD